MSMSVSFSGDRGTKNSRPLEVGDLVFAYAKAHYIGIIRQKIIGIDGAYAIEVEWPDRTLSITGPGRVRLQEDAVREAEHTVTWHLRQRSKAAARFGVAAVIRRP